MSNNYILIIIILILISCSESETNQVIDEHHSIITTSGEAEVSTSKKVLDHFQNARDHLYNESFQNAQTEILMALKIEPENSILLNLVGLIETKLYNYDSAEEYLKKSIVSDSSNPDPYINLSQLYIWNKEFSKSIEFSNLILKSTNNEKAIFAANYQLCQAYANLNKCELANRYYDIATKYIDTEIEQSTLTYYKNNFLDRKCNKKWFKPVLE